MDLTQLNEHFGLPGILRFEQTANGLIRAEITTAAATATIYLQGAHLTHWQPVGHEPVLFVSKKAEFAPGKAIRGGVPISFPWFAVDQKADRIHGKPGPSHGFARTEEWTLAFAAISGEDMHMVLTLGPNETSRSMGFDQFRVAFELVIGRTLRMRLTIANDAEAPLFFEEALHTYFAVGDVRQTTVTGLEEVPFLDKTQDGKEMPPAHAPISFYAETNRIYERTTATCVLHDAVNHRRITVEKANSKTTVVWNPWQGMTDMGTEEWQGMLCVETVNAAGSPITLERNQTHTMEALISMEAVA